MNKAFLKVYKFLLRCKLVNLMLLTLSCKNQINELDFHKSIRKTIPSEVTGKFPCR